MINRELPQFFPKAALSMIAKRVDVSGQVTSGKASDHCFYGSNRTWGHGQPAKTDTDKGHGFQRPAGDLAT